MKITKPLVFMMILILVSSSGCILETNGEHVADADGDGVEDEYDECPDTPGDPSNNGCPSETTTLPPSTTILDTDGDGVEDEYDECPDTPGDPSNNGCPQETTIPSDDLPPVPFITSPSNSWVLHGNSWNITAVSEEEIRLVAVDLNLAGDIVSTVFEYSSSGEQWTLIGEDDDPSFEGEWFGEEGDVRNGEGLGGWNAWWDLSGLPEGQYYLRATMRDEAGQEGSYISEIYYDPTPPVPEILAPAFGGMVAGMIQFVAATLDDDISYYELELFNGSGNTVSQRNIGDQSQYDVGPNADGSNTLDGKNNFCGPTSVANGLWRLADKNSDLKKFGGKELSLEDMAKLLAKKMAPTVPGDDANKTKGLEEVQKKGVTPEQLQRGVQDYLTEIGLGCENDEGYTVRIISNPTWEDYLRELKSGQCVIVFIIPKGKTSGGHFVTGKSGNNQANSDNSHTFGVTDPQNAWNATDKSGTWKNGNEVSYDGKDQYVHSLIIICPKSSTDIPQDTFVSIDPAGSNNIDYSSSGGWTVGYNTREVHDGFFLFRASMVDGQGNTGTDLVSIYVNNDLPAPMIVYPIEDDIVNGTVAIGAVDALGSEDISTTAFEFQDGGGWQAITIDEDGSDGWGAEWDTTNVPDGTYLLKATMTDYGGGGGVDWVEVRVINGLDDTDPIVEITSPENNVEVSTPHIDVIFFASDYGSGISRIDYTLEWLGGSMNDSGYYDPSSTYVSITLEIFSLREGWNRVTVGAEDAAGNYGSASVDIYYVPAGDATPPVTTKEVGQPNADDGFEITPYTPIWLHATDEQSGVAHIYYEIAWDNDGDGVWDEIFQEMVLADTVEIHTQDWGILHGTIELRWYAVDNAENMEQTHYQQHNVAAEVDGQFEYNGHLLLFPFFIL